MILFVSDVKGKGLRPGPQGKEGSVRAWTCFRIHAFTQGPFDGNPACGRATPLSPPPAVLHHIKPEADDGRLEMNLPSRPPSHAKLPDPIVEALSTASPSMLSRALSSMKDPVKRLRQAAPSSYWSGCTGQDSTSGSRERSKRRGGAPCTLLAGDRVILRGRALTFSKATLTCQLR